VTDLRAQAQAEFDATLGRYIEDYATTYRNWSHPMTTTTAAPVSASVLSSKAMLVCLNISSWGNRAFDREISDKVADEHKADRDIGTYNKRLVRKDALREIGGALNEARIAHYKNTLPWLDNGFRILPSDMYWAYVADQQKARERFDRAVEAFIVEYPALVADAQERHNGLFRASDYPPVHQLRRRYSMEYGVLPLPDATDFRVQLTEGEIDKLRVAIEKRVNDAFVDAVKDLWSRLTDCVTAIRDRLAIYKLDRTTGKVQNPFRDSTFENLKHLVAMLPKLNVTDDPELARVGARLAETLCTLSTQDLREDVTERQAAIVTADDILAQMQGYCS
jgi:hypothetical protein